jgi:hypothetical protein
MLGNLHVRFGGGGEETQCGCASCPYLTVDFNLRGTSPLAQYLARWASEWCQSCAGLA